MLRTVLGGWMCGVVAWSAGGAVAADSPSTTDPTVGRWTIVQPFEADSGSGSDASHGAVVPETREPRLYVSGMLAGSGQMRSGGDLTIPGPVPAAVGLAGGGAGGEAAFGLAVPRPGGWLRLELEAGGRTTAASAETGQQWSSLVNAWRDIDLTERVGVYAGGGIGVGDGVIPDGMTSPPIVAPAATALAWQAGAGLTYAATDRVTLDLGYRQRWSAPGDTGLGAGEALLAVRIYDPFRGWLK